MYAVIMVIACLKAIGVGVLGIWTKLEIESAVTYYYRFFDYYISTNVYNNISIVTNGFV